MSGLYHIGELEESARAVYFDMDGTIADLYSVEGWRDELDSFSTRPYQQASLMVSVEDFNAFVQCARDTDWKLGIISWMSQGASPSYEREIIEAKTNWLKNNLPPMDEIIISKYGIPKHNLVRPLEAILIDDETANRIAWNNSGSLRQAYHANDMREVMNLLIHSMS